jgi:hypothetical protein
MGCWGILCVAVLTKERLLNVGSCASQAAFLFFPERRPKFQLRLALLAQTLRLKPIKAILKRSIF